MTGTGVLQSLSALDYDTIFLFYKGTYLWYLIFYVIYIFMFRSYVHRVVFLSNTGMVFSADNAVLSQVLYCFLSLKFPVRLSFHGHVE
jgi:hypothetical protein